MTPSTNSDTTPPRRQRPSRFDRDHPHDRWIALSNTTLGMLMAAISSSIVIISLPTVFRGIHLDPLEPGNVGFAIFAVFSVALALDPCTGGAGAMC